MPTRHVFKGEIVQFQDIEIYLTFEQVLNSHLLI